MNQPFANTTTAVDFVFWLIVIISMFLLLLVTGLMIYFAVRYNRTRNPKASEVPEHPLLEITWTAIPTLIVLVMFWYGYRAYLTIRTGPADAFVIKVTGHMWAWDFEYPNGKKSAEVMYVPSGKDIRAELRSTDVIHGFYIPEFRIKEDVVPGKNNYLYFKPQGFGPANIFCSQFCGLKHTYMLGRVEVMEPAVFDAWYNSTNVAPAGVNADATGFKLLAQNGCLNCHRLDEDKLIGPGFRGSFGRKVVLADGSTTIADGAYLLDSILKPGKQVVKGYPNVMPTLTSVMTNDAQIIVEYIKTLK